MEERDAFRPKVLMREKEYGGNQRAFLATIRANLIKQAVCVIGDQKRRALPEKIRVIFFVFLPTWLIFLKSVRFSLKQQKMAVMAGGGGG